MSKEVINKLKTYKGLKADINLINIRLEEIEDEILGVSALPSEERTSNTYKITSTVENQAERHLEAKERLLQEKIFKEREIAKIDNSLTVLKEEERDIITTIYINQMRYAVLEIKYDRSFRRIKQIEAEAIKKIEKYL